MSETEKEQALGDLGSRFSREEQEVYGLISRSEGLKAREIAGFVLIAGALVACTAYLVDATYNPFLYFRF